MLNKNPSSAHCVCKWGSIWRGVFFASMFVLVMPTWADTPSSRIGNIAEKFSNFWYKLWSSDEEYTLMGGTRIIPPPIHMPLLEKGNAKLKAGKEVVYLSWELGNSPYKVDVQNKDNFAKWVEFTSVYNNYVALTTQHLEKLGFTEGASYEVLIIDDEYDQSVTNTFQVVADLPLPNDDEAQVIRQSQNKLLECASWLAKQGKEWGFEASQLLYEEGGDKALLSVCGITR
jgi:hypothetical protein